MHASKPPHARAKVFGAKNRGSVKSAASGHASSGRVILLNEAITLGERDFDRFKKNMKSEQGPTEAGLKAARLHATLQPRLKT